MIKIKKSEACFTLLRTLSYVWHFRFSTKPSSFWTSRYNQWRNKGGTGGPGPRAEPSGGRHFVDKN